jgi:hypothetical protein
MWHANDRREKAIEAASLLNNLLLDLLVGTRGLEIYNVPMIAQTVQPALAIGLNRMGLFHLVITLSKWAEFYKRYKSILPADVQKECRALNENIKARGVVNFRNKVVGHICDKDTSRPLTTQEIQQKLETVIGGQHQDFLLWINNPASNVFPNSVVAVTEHVRDRLRQEFQLKESEIL